MGGADAQRDEGGAGAGASRAVETGTDQLLCRIEARVAVVTLNRPEARNALSWELKGALLDLLTPLGAASDVGCLLLTGAGSAFGIHPEDINRSGDACTDFYDYANGTWREKNTIPDYMDRWSRRWQSGEVNKEHVRDNLTELSARTDWPKGSAGQLAGDFYAALVRPNWAPPAWLFGPVWTLLYAAMAIAAWLVSRAGSIEVVRTPIALFLMQLMLNGLWSWLFFVWQLGALAFIDIALRWCCIVATLVVLLCQLDFVSESGTFQD